MIERGIKAVMDPKLSGPSWNRLPVSKLIKHQQNGKKSQSIM